MASCVFAPLLVLGLAATRAKNVPRQMATAPPRLAKHDRARLAWLLVEQRAIASLLVAYSPHHADALLPRLASLGGMNHDPASLA